MKVMGTPRLVARRSMASRAGPSPTKTSRHLTPASWTAAALSTSRRRFFSNEIRPTNRSAISSSVAAPVGGPETSRLKNLARCDLLKERGEKRAVSTPRLQIRTFRKPLRSRTPAVEADGQRVTLLLWWR